MKTLAAALTLAASIESAASQTDPATATLRVERTDQRAASIGPAASFTGRVMVTRPFRAEAPARAGGAFVSFEPGARTAWHTHPLGQTLVVIHGSGLVQCWGGPVQVIEAGDVVWIPPHVKHWHGASTVRGMTHVAIAEHVDGKSVDWLEHVTDAQYTGRMPIEGTN